MSADHAPADALVRPELIALDPASRQRVLQQVAAKGGYCECCGKKGFDVGHALFLGFLFLDEKSDAYMVALTCRNPECAKPRSGIVLPEKDFLSDDLGDDGIAWPLRARRR